MVDNNGIERATRREISAMRESGPVKGFGCWPRPAVRRILAAGVRKPPGEETAMGERVSVPLALWGFGRRGWGLGAKTSRLIATVVGEGGYQRRVVEVCAASR
jgi:hypothetical protein